jgi:hypothetical protein
MINFWIGFIVGGALVGAISAGLFVFLGKKVAKMIKAILGR